MNTKTIKINGYIEKAEDVDQYINSDIDIFICGISLEDRCSRGWEILKEKRINVNKKIILYFKEVISENLTGEEYFNKLFDLTSTDSKLHVNIYNEESGLIEIGRTLNDFIDFEKMKIMIDMSVLVKPYLFILLKYLIYQKKIKKIYLLYTEPLSYHKPKIEMFLKSSGNFTKGTSRTGEILSFSGINNLTKKNALIILLGFEGERALEVANAVDPDITIPINGFPAYRPEFKDISLLLNEELLRESEIFNNLQYAPANDPFETKNMLEQIYSKYSNEYNLSLAPLGTKPMGLGSCLFALQHSECRIIYPYPIEYNLKSSQGYGASWTYILQIL